jgi:glucosamine--fructose-6-phosphate aminotransferase (isomerizing)
MKSGSPYSLVNEMLEAPGLLRRFDAAPYAEWTKAIDKNKCLFLTGEGASRIFPAKNLIDQSLRKRSAWKISTEGARQAAEYDLQDFIVIALSNSGRTRETISLVEKLKREHVTTYGITATAGSKLTELVNEFKILSCGPEKAIASSKSVIEQALACQSLLKGDEWKSQAKAADYCEAVLSRAIVPEITESIKSASLIYFAGRNNGVAEELALKTNEIVRKKSAYLEGTYALHGIEEVMQKGEVLVLVEPFKEEVEKYRDVLAGRIGVNIVAISSFDTPFPTIKIPSLEGFNGYIQLLAGWNMLVAAGLASGVDLDKTLRARKVGNAIQ